VASSLAAGSGKKIFNASKSTMLPQAPARFARGLELVLAAGDHGPAQPRSRKAPEDIEIIPGPTGAKNPAVSHNT